VGESIARNIGRAGSTRTGHGGKQQSNAPKSFACERPMSNAIDERHESIFDLRDAQVATMSWTYLRPTQRRARR